MGEIRVVPVGNKPGQWRSKDYNKPAFVNQGKDYIIPVNEKRSHLLESPSCSMDTTRIM